MYEFGGQAMFPPFHRKNQGKQGIEKIGCLIMSPPSGAWQVFSPEKKITHQFFWPYIVPGGTLLGGVTPSLSNFKLFKSLTDKCNLHGGGEAKRQGTGWEEKFRHSCVGFRVHLLDVLALLCQKQADDTLNVSVRCVNQKRDMGIRMILKIQAKRDKLICLGSRS